MAYTSLLTEIHGRVGLITFDRPQALNALNPQLLGELMQALSVYDADPEIGAVLLTGSERVFAAGADIKFMAGASSAEMRANGFVELFEGLRKIRKPVIAAVSGFALGGGCELALACDLIVASETARFGQPEITIGVIPGGGGTQRLARALGKALTMEMVLNNRTLTAAEALHFGLVNRVVPVELVLKEGLALATEIAVRAPLAVISAKQAVNNAYESSLTAGLAEERDLFHNLFDTSDQKEGMQAFLEKRKPRWQGR
ncbi:MAG: enoyl-CoA hydratase-related protein [Chloroflexi bacterium]|nr:enoyl-CoA hydratase-related protein [Chloroflexota bacterium]